jgi:hypothetical protein
MQDIAHCVLSATLTSSDSFQTCVAHILHNLNKVYNLTVDLGRAPEGSVPVVPPPSCGILPVLPLRYPARPFSYERRNVCLSSSHALTALCLHVLHFFCSFRPSLLLSLSSFFVYTSVQLVINCN